MKQVRSKELDVERTINVKRKKKGKETNMSIARMKQEFL